jgi:alpha-beta hydrolase superfamily lysophospholipase
MSDGVIERFEARTPDGWILAMRRTTASVEEGLTAARPRRPVLIVPGYGMNSFIFGYHPRGRSIEAHLAWRGFEVWSVDLRAQGRSRHAHGVKALFGLEQLALVDVNAAITEVLARTRTGATHVDVIGASLGAALMFGHAAVNRDDRLGSLVSFGGPLRWERVHPALALAFRSPALAGAVPFRGTRALARLALPVLAKIPALLSVYLNPAITDVSRAADLVQTVEDPVPQVNREIAVWIRDRDLTLRGVNVTHGASTLVNPLLCVVAMGDGIVPPETARAPYDLTASRSKRVLEVGDANLRIAHADLFISNDAHSLVFDPVARWLGEQSP